MFMFNFNLFIMRFSYVTFVIATIITLLAMTRVHAQDGFQVSIGFGMAKFDEAFSDSNDSGLMYGVSSDQDVDSQRGTINHWSSQDVAQAYLSFGRNDIVGTVFIGGSGRTSLFDSANPNTDQANGVGNIGLMIGKRFHFGEFNVQLSAGYNLIQLWEPYGARNMDKMFTQDPNLGQPVLNRQFGMPMGEIKFGFKFIEVAYAPLMKTATFGFRLSR